MKYVLQDWQGSSRAILSNSGYFNARVDYTAFGEEIQAGVGQRTAPQGYGVNNSLSQKYALTERDKATGVDHTWFRKLENQAGRWTSPDPYNGSMNLGNPQSFNRYSYVENQPTNFVDPSGLLLRMDCRFVASGWYGEFLYEVWQCVIYDDGLGGGNFGGGIAFGGGAAGASATPPPPNCDDITEAIRKAYKQVVRRAIELKQDILDFVPRGIITKQDLANYISNLNASVNIEAIRRQGSVEGHKEQFEGWQRNLQKNLNKYDDNNCNNKLPVKVRKVATMKTPDRTRPIEQRATPISQ